MISGVYQIKNIVTGKMYIGSAVNMKRRNIEHFSQLKHNKHHNIYLQRAFNNHGMENFKFEILAYCPPTLLIELEQWYIDNLNPEYNICLIAQSRFGCRLSIKTRQLLSDMKRNNPSFISSIERSKNAKTSYILHNNKPIIAHNNKKCIEFNSISAAAKILGVCRPNIHRALKSGNLIRGWKIEYVV